MLTNSNKTATCPLPSNHRIWETKANRTNRHHLLSSKTCRETTILSSPNLKSILRSSRSNSSNSSSSSNSLSSSNSKTISNSSSNNNLILTLMQIVIISKAEIRCMELGLITITIISRKPHLISNSKSTSNRMKAKAVRTI